MTPRIESLPKTTLVGFRTQMSIAQNKTGELWRRFMPQRHQISHVASEDFYSVEVYPDSVFFQQFDPTREFEKWAAVKVSEPENLPEGMEQLVVPAGLYAIFLYRGKGSEAAAAYQYILGEWLPQSGYQLDDRPHLAVMGDKYQNESPDSEEELWVPIRRN